jgi:hypothetical protein
MENNYPEMIIMVISLFILMIIIWKLDSYIDTKWAQVVAAFIGFVSFVGLNTILQNIYQFLKE